MNTTRPCGCKGMRSCYICEKQYNLVKSDNLDRDKEIYIYCNICKKAWPGWNVQDNPHNKHTGEFIEYPGIYIQENFLSKTEEQTLTEALDVIPWDLSQSGRRKQNFGPKCNFKKRKIKLGDFKGFPLKTKFVQDYFHSVPIMKGFKTIEQCSLEYNSDRGASIDPHIDDCWIWGERIITVNLLSDSVLTMSYNDKPDRYNLDCVKTYPSILDRFGNFNVSSNYYNVKPLIHGENFPIVRIAMPKRSLLVMYGSARYDWEHRILREDILNRRVCLAYREFTPPYLEFGDKYEEVKDILQTALNFYEPNSIE